MGPGHLVSTWGWRGQAEKRWKTANDFKYQEKSFWLRIRYLCLFQNFPQQMNIAPPHHRKLETVGPVSSMNLGLKLCRKYWTYNSQCPDEPQNQFSDKIRNGHSTHLWVQGGTSKHSRVFLWKMFAQTWECMRPPKDHLKHYPLTIKGKSLRIHWWMVFRTDKGKIPTPQKCNWLID